MSFVIAMNVSRVAQCFIIRDVILGLWRNFTPSWVQFFIFTYSLGNLKPFQVNTPFLYPLETENQWLSVFRGYRKITVAWNWLKLPNTVILYVAFRKNSRRIKQRVSLISKPPRQRQNTQDKITSTKEIFPHSFLR